MPVLASIKLIMKPFPISFPVLLLLLPTSRLRTHLLFLVLPVLLNLPFLLPLMMIPCLKIISLWAFSLAIKLKGAKADELER